jgi:hypothetical protein
LRVATTIVTSSVSIGDGPVSPFSVVAVDDMASRIPGQGPANQADSVNGRAAAPYRRHLSLRNHRGWQTAYAIEPPSFVP